MSVTLITGAGSGIGRGLVGVLGDKFDVLATDFDEASLAQAAQTDGWSPNVQCAQLDVREAASWERILANQPVDRLLNVAGVLYPGWVHELDLERVRQQFEVNALGVITGTTLASRVMVERGRGQIINIASLAALAPVPGLSVYSASKHAVRAFTLAAAIELRERGVSLTVICPDAVQTPMLDQQRGHQEASLTFSGSAPLTVSQVAAAVMQAINEKPLEIVLPATRGWMAKTANTFPALGRVFHKRLFSRGSARRTSS